MRRKRRDHSNKHPPPDDPSDGGCLLILGIGHASDADAQGGEVVQQGGSGGRKDSGRAQNDQSTVETDHKPVISVNARLKLVRDAFQRHQLGQGIRSAAAVTWG